MPKSTLHHAYQHPMLSKQDVEAICDEHTLEDYPKGHILLKEGQISNEYFIVQEGLVRSYVYNYQGEDITTGFAKEKDILIEVASIFARVPTREYMQCLTDVKLWRIGFQDFEKLFDLYPAFREWGRAWMSRELYKNKNRATEMITLPATERYLQLLENHPQVVLQSPLKYIASYLGVTDTSLSRIRKEIADTK